MSLTLKVALVCWPTVMTTIYVFFSRLRFKKNDIGNNKPTKTKKAL